MEKEQKELTKDLIKEAIAKKRCPYCGENDFSCTLPGAYQSFWFDEKGETVWKDILDDGIEVVWCKNCEKEISKEIWSEWFKIGVDVGIHSKDKKNEKTKRH